MREWLDRRVGRDEGVVTAFVVIFAVVLIFVTGLVLDGGRTLVAYREARNVADAAARAGAQGIDEQAIRNHDTQVLNPTLAEQRACAIVAHSNFTCGTNASVVTVGNTVTVSIQTDVDMWLISGVTSTLTVEGSACAAIGITGLEPTAQC
jgi:Flp pilus assembly protein TadG